MTEIMLGTLVDLPPRDAWRNEERDFTPWLAANIHLLGDAIGMPLEPTGTEVPVERFEADLLARNPMDGRIVRIENQMEPTDHAHLGQIMTYLAGLDAHTIVWIAPQFREPHLSAIRWLNAHTPEEFAFFAVQVRVVRIGESPLAPVFEVVEQPNGWERRLTASRRAAEGLSPLGEQRRAFWQAYLDRVPGAAQWGLRPIAKPTARLAVSGLSTPAVLSLWVGQHDCGAFLRGPLGETHDALVAELAPHAAALAQRLGATFAGDSFGFLWKRFGKGFADPAVWPEVIDWMEQTRQDYLAALAGIARRPGP